ncbi:MAG: cobalt ECF transporter T component CbiQ [Candidatus Omnitrophica bacterium]|nr:cobalt ECF transporter T component CbiQ [Candidatus Omnitrophota bacterium]
MLIKRSNNFLEHFFVSVLSFLKESMFTQEYAAKRGFLQKIYPVFRVLIFVSLLLAAMFSRSLYFLAGMYLVCLMLAVFSSIQLGFFLKRTLFFIPLFCLFIGLPALLNIVTPGEPVFSFKIFAFSLSITKQGIISAGFFFMRVLVSVSLCVLLVLTTRHNVLLRVLRVFRVPQVFVMILGMCYRYVYLFIEIIQNTYLAVKSRVGRQMHYKKGQRVVAWNIASLWIRSYDLSQQVYSAMLSRGYTGEPKTLE